MILSKTLFVSIEWGLTVSWYTLYVFNISPFSPHVVPGSFQTIDIYLLAIFLRVLSETSMLAVCHRSLQRK